MPSKIYGLFSVTFQHWDWQRKKYRVSLSLAGDREATDYLFRLSNFGMRRVIRKRVLTQLREAPFWHESFVPLLIHLK